ncbi:MAG: hypothetical protein R6U28_01650 [Cyclonatronaceae bacterium]
MQRDVTNDRVRSLPLLTRFFLFSLLFQSTLFVPLSHLHFALRLQTTFFSGPCVFSIDPVTGTR